MSGWAPIKMVKAGSSLDRTTLIVTDGVGTTALAFCEGGDWYLGEASAEYREDLDFNPEFWMHRDYPFNPFRATFPDGRDTIAARAGRAT
jgi:hypothetical protein